MGGTAAVVTAATVASTLMTERSQRKDSYKAADRKMKIEEKRRKNVLEEQLAKRRAMIGSMGVSDSGSVLNSQSKVIKDSYNNINNYGAYESDSSYNLRMANKLTGNLLNMGSQMIK